MWIGCSLRLMKLRKKSWNLEGEFFRPAVSNIALTCECRVYNYSFCCCAINTESALAELCWCCTVCLGMNLAQSIKGRISLFIFELTCMQDCTSSFLAPFVDEMLKWIRHWTTYLKKARDKRCVGNQLFVDLAVAKDWAVSRWKWRYDRRRRVKKKSGRVPPPKQVFFHPNPWEMIQFGKHIFQRGWFNHQLDSRWVERWRNINFWDVFCSFWGALC